VAAIRAAQRGAQVTVIERAEVGGVCLNSGCIPTRPSSICESLERARHADDFGVEIAEWGRLPACQDQERRGQGRLHTGEEGIRGLFKSWGVNLINGRGLLLSPDVVRVVQDDGTTMDVKSDRVIIATGSRPAKLPGFPFDGECVITSDEAVQLKRIPASLLIVGAGVIGSEFAFIYRTFGSDVTMAEMMPRALSTEDEDMADIIEREFKKAKIKLFTNVKVEKVEKGTDGMMVATLSGGRR
jgi:dihydrolipoamide dehydrogenase